jgi:hypothetical protein
LGGGGGNFNQKSKVQGTPSQKSEQPKSIRWNIYEFGQLLCYYFLWKKGVRLSFMLEKSFVNTKFCKILSLHSGQKITWLNLVTLKVLADMRNVYALVQMSAKRKKCLEHFMLSSHLSGLVHCILLRTATRITMCNWHSWQIIQQKRKLCGNMFNWKQL